MRRRKRRKKKKKKDLYVPDYAADLTGAGSGR